MFLFFVLNKWKLVMLNLTAIVFVFWVFLVFSIVDFYWRLFLTSLWWSLLLTLHDVCCFVPPEYNIRIQIAGFQSLSRFSMTMFVRSSLISSINISMILPVFWGRHCYFETNPSFYLYFKKLDLRIQLPKGAQCHAFSPASCK